MYDGENGWVRGHKLGPTACSFYSGMNPGVGGSGGTCDLKPSSHTFWMEAWSARPDQDAGAVRLGVSQSVSATLDAGNVGTLRFEYSATVRGAGDVVAHVTPSDADAAREIALYCWFSCAAGVSSFACNTKRPCSSWSHHQISVARPGVYFYYLRLAQTGDSKSSFVYPSGCEAPPPPSNYTLAVIVPADG